MKTKINIDIIDVNGQKVDSVLDQPNVKESAEKMIKDLCKGIKEFYRKKKINIKIDYEIESQ